MKKYLGLLAFLLVSFTFVTAQGNGGNNGNGNGGYGNNGNGGNGNSGNWNGGNGNGGNSNNQWANFNLPQWLQTWLNNGGQIPHLLAAEVIFEARSWGQQNFGLNYGQMLQKYAQGTLTIEYIPNSPPAPTTPVVLAFRVRYGIGEIVILDSF